MQYPCLIVSSIVNWPSRVFRQGEQVFPFWFIYDSPTGKLVHHCECAPYSCITKTQAHQNHGTSCIINVASQQRERIDVTPHCGSKPTCCGRGLWGGGVRRHLLNNAISGFGHHVMMAHSGLNLLCWTAHQYCLKLFVVASLSSSYCRARLKDNSGECHSNLMAWKEAISSIQAIDWWGREPLILPEMFTCLDCSLILPPIIYCCRSIMLILQGQAEQQLMWVPPKSHGI